MKNDYQKPTMQIVVLQHTDMLMLSDGMGASRSGYGSAEEQTWGDKPASCRLRNSLWDNE